MNKLKTEESKKKKKNEQDKESENKKKKTRLEEKIEILLNSKKKRKIKDAKEWLFLYDFSEIKSAINTLPELKDTENLLVLKYTLKESKVDNLALAILSAVISGMLPVFIMNGLLPTLYDLLLSKITNFWYSLLIGLFLIVLYVTVAYFCVRYILHDKFLDNVKIDVIVDLIDIEIEERKKAPVKNTSAEK